MRTVGTFVNKLFKEGKDGFYALFIKRALDFLLAGFGLLILFIPMCIIAFATYLSTGESPLFCQIRIGCGEKPFKLFKFRSMRTEYDEYGVPLPDYVRMTRLGHFLRSTSLDELPSLINIIKGEMSIVGPRPLPENYLPWYTAEERKRHSIRGGLTGLAQVHGRNIASWETRFSYDLEYVDRVSFLLDLRIVSETVGMIAERRNIGTRGVDVPPDFHVMRSGLSERELTALSEAAE